MIPFLKSTLSHWQIAAILGAMVFFHNHPKPQALPISCPCKAEPPPEFVCTSQVEAGKISEVAFLKPVLNSGMTVIEMEDQSKFVMEGLLSIQTGKPAFIQTWTSAKSTKRALAVEGQPLPHWLVE